MGASSPKDIDFSKLKDTSVRGEELQALTEAILRKLQHRTERGGRGSDGGRDLFSYEIVRGDFIEHQRKWLVQCKDFAKSKKAVNEDEVGDIAGDCTKHQVDGYLLVTTTTVTAELAKKLEAYTVDRAAPFLASFWDEHRLRTLLMSDDMRDVLRQYLPEAGKNLELRNADLLRGYLSGRGVGESAMSPLVGTIEKAIAEATRPSPVVQAGEVFPYATAHRSLIEQAVNQFDDEDAEGCAESMMEMPFEEWSALVGALAQKDDDLTAEVLEHIAEESPDEHQRFNALTALADQLHRSLDDLTPHMRGLGHDSITDLADRFNLAEAVDTALQHQVIDHEPGDLDDLPAHRTTGVSTGDVAFALKDGDAITASVEFSAEVDVTTDGEEYEPYSFPGKASLAIRGEDDVEVEKLQIDTTGFFGIPDEPEEEPPP